jgi:hypothetical protein
MVYRMTSLLDQAFYQDESSLADAMYELGKARADMCAAKKAVDIEEERYNTVFERIQKETNEAVLEQLVKELSVWGSHLDRAVYVLNHVMEALNVATERLNVLLVA